MAFRDTAVLQTFLFLPSSEMSELSYAVYIWYLSYTGQTWQGSCAVEVVAEAEFRQEQLALSLWVCIHLSTHAVAICAFYRIYLSLYNRINTISHKL